jgi:D-alanine-D-alanine ligase
MKKNIAVVMGGYSGEAQISMLSGATVLANLDANEYNIYKVIISKEKWVLEQNNKEYHIDKNDFSVTIDDEKLNFDCVFNIIHGTPGEDGKFQGYLDMLSIPHTSCDVAVSALTFNKGMTTSLLKTYGIHVAESVVLLENKNIDEQAILKKVGLPCFVKPNNGGSSLGTFKVTKLEQLKVSIDKAFDEGGQVIIEEFISGTEVTCSAFMQNGKGKAMAITEIVATVEFFDFDAKYKDNSTQEITPARIPQDKYNECMKLTEYIYDVLGCWGLVRSDYILKGNNFYLIEVNSIPGLTERSLTPQHAEYLNLSKKDLFSIVTKEALARK